MAGKKPRVVIEEDAEENEARAAAVAAAMGPARRTIPQDVDVSRILDNPWQARQEFTDIAELAREIGELGFTSRLLARLAPNKPGYYQIAYGGRRLRAAREAGLATIPLDVSDLTDRQMYMIGLAENDQRVDLSPLEQAAAYRTGKDHFGLTYAELSQQLGRGTGYIQDRLKLLELPTDVQEMVRQRPDTLRAAREIGKLENPEHREQLIDAVVSETVNVDDVRTLVREGQAHPDTPLPLAPRPPARPSRPAPSPQQEANEEDEEIIPQTTGEIRLIFPSEELLARAIADLTAKYGDRVELRPYRRHGEIGNWRAYGTFRLEDQE